MYNYPHYKEHDPAEILEFMHKFPFVTIIGYDKKGRIAVTQVPVLVEEIEGKISIKGHIARKSDHHLAFEENPEVLILFTSPHSYISGTWYTGEPHLASTWNYISIHARGKVVFGDPEDLVPILKKLTLHFENYNESSSTVYDNLPSEYREKLMKAIIPFTMEVEELENVYKISQNRDEVSYRNIIKKLEEQGDDGKFIAGEMRKREQKLFSK